MKNLNVIISGGGTGGHIFPALSIANAIKEMVPSANILFVGAKGRMEMEKVPAAGYKIIGLDVAGLQRSLSLSNLALPFKLYKSIHRAGKIIRDFKPDVAVGVGGYASAPLLWSAGMRKIPYVIQEQNSFAGLTNKIVGKKAKVICTAYEGMDRFFPKDRIVLTGNPIRSNLKPATAEIRAEAIDFYHLDPTKKTVLIVGGSLGARTLNNCMSAWLPRSAESGIQVIWQCGSYYYNAQLQESVKPYATQVQLHPFIQRMDLAYAAADVVVSRSGASSISELCVLGKACIFVPSPNVAEDHQTCNAMALVKRNAAIMVSDIEAAGFLMSQVEALCADGNRRQVLCSNILQMARPNAAAEIAAIVLKTAGYEQE